MFRSIRRSCWRALASRVRIDLVPRGGKLHVILDGEDITDWIRTPEVSHAASLVAVVPGVRHPMVAEQRRAGAQGGVVMEGRDIGSVVFPHADLKIYLDASPEVRAERRRRELHEKGEVSDPLIVLAEVHERDRRDREREMSPLVRAADAVVVDNTAMDAEETARVIVLLAQEKVKASGELEAASCRPAFHNGSLPVLARALPQDRSSTQPEDLSHAVTRSGWTSKREIRRSTSISRGVRRAIPWLRPARGDSAPCAAPTRGSVRRAASAILLFACRNG